MINDLLYHVTFFLINQAALNTKAKPPQRLQNKKGRKLLLQTNGTKFLYRQNINTQRRKSFKSVLSCTVGQSIIFPSPN